MKKDTVELSPSSDHVRRAFDMITGKWKLEILRVLFLREHRFGELQRSIPGITQHMLTAQLRALEADRLISRKVYAEVPPRVEYALLPAALGLAPVMQAIVKWCREFGNERDRLPRKRAVSK